MSEHSQKNALIFQSNALSLQSNKESYCRIKK